MKTIKRLTLIPLMLLTTACIQRVPEQQQQTVIWDPPTTNQGTVVTYPDTTYPDTTLPPVTQPVQIVEVPYEQTRSRYLQGSYSNNYKLKNFITMMARKHKYDKYKLNAIFSTVRRDSQALEKIGAFRASKPTQSKAVMVGSWDKYRGNFLTESRISKGVNFWKENLNYLNQASQRYGVAPEYIVGIIGVETNFGGYTGKHSVLDALTSIALEFPKREKFFTSELENYLLMLRDEKIHPQKIKGSYAGAFGLSQFMPSSFREYAVDLDQDGHINLFTNADAIGSVANYFRGRGKWNNRIPVAMKTYYNKKRFHGLPTGFRTRYTQSHMHSLGMRPSSNFYGYKDKVSLIKLSRYSRDEMWWGTPNFHAIARYNPKDHYAMAVHQLAQAIRRAYYRR